MASVAVAPDGERLFIGTSSGVILVYAADERAAASGEAHPLRLVSRKLHAAKPVEARPRVASEASLCLSVRAAAPQALVLFWAVRRVAVLCDGGVSLLDADTLTGVVVSGLRGATAIAPVRAPLFGKWGCAF